MKYLARYVVCLAMGCATSASAGPLEGARKIMLETADGARHIVADITFTDAGDGRDSYVIDWDDTRFGDHFLSMRPFKCMEGDTKYWCRVPYPYENKREVSAEDLTDLEYDLLFLWKGVGEYGINMWNGVYYDLTLDGDRLTGQIHEMDMDILSAPPDAGDLRPVGEHDLEPGEPEGHWLPIVVIE